MFVFSFVNKNVYRSLRLSSFETEREITLAVWNQYVVCQNSVSFSFKWSQHLSKTFYLLIGFAISKFLTKLRLYLI